MRVLRAVARPALSHRWEPQDADAGATPMRVPAMPLQPLPECADGLRVDWATVTGELIPLVGPWAESALAAWRIDRPAAVGPLEGFVHERVFDVLPDAVEPLLSPPIERWPFPVGTRKDAWALKALDDMTGGQPLALAHHRFVEAEGRVPSWPEVCEWMVQPAIAPTFYAPAWALWHSLPEAERPSRGRWQRGIAWRIGNAYLSFLREMDFLSRMTHRHRVPLRFHIVADAVLKVDFWAGSSLVCVWMPNEYRDRKASPPAERGVVHDFTLRLRGTGWNSVMRASDEDLARLARDMGR